MKGIPIEKLKLPQMRKYFAKWIERSFMNTIKEHKQLQLSAFDGAGINYYSTYVHGGYEGLPQSTPTMYSDDDEKSNDNTNNSNPKRKRGRESELNAGVDRKNKRRRQSDIHKYFTKKK